MPAGEVAALVEAAGFAIDVWNDPTADLLPAVAAITRAAAGHGPRLTPALYVPDAATRFACTLRNLEEGRTQLLYGVATAT